MKKISKVVVYYDDGTYEETVSRSDAIKSTFNYPPGVRTTTPWVGPMAEYTSPLYTMDGKIGLPETLPVSTFSINTKV